jgi:short-subunit dehydrogenase
MAKSQRIQLRGSTALVTGASAGIGLAIAQRLAQSGANLVLAARRPGPLEEAAASLRPLRIKAIVVPTDVSQLAALEALVARAMGELGKIDVLVNNAGIEAFSHYDALPPEQIAETVATNLTSALLLTRLVVPHMLKAGRGHIVNVASTAGKYGIPFGAAYGTTKAGLINFTQALRAEYRGRGVSASVICPGFTEQGGIYDRMREQSGRGSPFLIGTTTTDRVAAAVVRAIERDKAELIVNWPPMRPIMSFAAAFPTLGGTLIRLASFRFLKRVAQANREKDEATP